MFKVINQIAALLDVCYFGIKYIFPVLTIAAFNFGCAKESNPVQSLVVVPPQPLSPGMLVPPFVNAYTKKYISERDTSFLQGSSNNKENISSYSWKKVYGPASYFIMTPDSLNTRVTNLEAGYYEFELTAKGRDGWEGKAVAKFYVIQPGSDQVLFPNADWNCAMAKCAIVIDNFHSFLPPGKPYKVFIQENRFSEWQKVERMSEWWADKYAYDQSGNSFWIQPRDPGGIVDIKITY